MPNDNVQTLTGHAVLDAPIRTAQGQASEATNVCAQEAQSTWGPSQQNGDNITTQMTQSAGAKCDGLPSLEIDGLDSNMGPFDPNYRRYGDNKPHFNDQRDLRNRNDFGFEYDYKNGSGKDGKGGCPQFEERDYTAPHGSPIPGKPDPRHNPHQGGDHADLNAIPGYDGKPGHFEKRKEDVQMQKMKEKLDGGKCGGIDGSRTETPMTERQLTESERIIEQKIIEQKIREMKLRERYRL
jgi:hypothetical protein